MKKLALLLVLALLTAANLFAQKMVDTRWSTGDMTLYCESDDGTTVKFSVGFTHEGGPDLIVKRVSNGVFEVVNTDAYSEVAKLKMVQYNYSDVRITNALYCENSKGVMTHVFQEVKDGFMEDIFYGVFNGTYTDSEGTEYIFDEGRLIIGDYDPVEYEPLACEMGYTTGFQYKGKRYCFRISENGINIYTTNSDEGEMEFEPDKLWVKLIADQESENGRWPFLKSRIVTEYFLGYFDKKLLRIMRNEIYARHGYKFSSADLTSYFSKMSWYEPVSDNNKVKLSDIEQVNVNLIKIAEDRDWHPDIEK